MRRSEVLERVQVHFAPTCKLATEIVLDVGMPLWRTVWIALADDLPQMSQETRAQPRLDQIGWHSIARQTERRSEWRI